MATGAQHEWHTGVEGSDVTRIVGPLIIVCLRNKRTALCLAMRGPKCERGKRTASRLGSFVR
eukprot:10738331-Heterocapsa_arctica.AAC.1